MDKLNQKMEEAKKEEKGATMVEYALMVALIAIVSITILTQLGGTIAAKFGQVDTAVAAAGN